MTKGKAMEIKNEDNEKRTKAMAKLNSAVVNVTGARKRLAEGKEKYQKLLNDAKSELGTAYHEVQKAERDLASAQKALEKVVPGLTATEKPELPTLDEALAETPEAAE